MRADLRHDAIRAPPNTETTLSTDASGESGLANPRTNPWTATLLPIPRAIVSNSASDSPGVRTKFLAEYRMSMRMLDKICFTLASERREQWACFL